MVQYNRYLLAQNVITPEQAKSIKMEIEDTGKKESDILLSGLFVDKDKMIYVKSAVIRSLCWSKNDTITGGITAKAEVGCAVRYQAIAFDDQPDHMKVAMRDPLDIQRPIISVPSSEKGSMPILQIQIWSPRSSDKIWRPGGSEVNKALEDVVKKWSMFPGLLRKLSL